MLELIIGKPDFTVDGVVAHMHGKLKATAKELFFAHVMAVICEQTVQIEKTDAMIQRSLSENYKAAVKALVEITGFGKVCAEQVIAETSIDMTRFRNQHSLSKWTGVCPGSNESAGKRKSGKTPRGNKTLKSTLTQCAKSAVKDKKCFFSAQYSRLVSCWGKNHATMAVEHSLLIAIYFVLCGHEFEDLGVDYYTKFSWEEKINSHVKQLSKLGVTIHDEILQTVAHAPPD